MLQLSSAILNVPVLSLRTGDKIAMAVAPVIDPKNLKIEGFYCEDDFDKKPLILLWQDVRETLPNGFVIDDHERLTEPDELIRLKSVLEMRFELLGKPVETAGKEKVGKVSDYAVETDSMYIQKIYVTQSLLKSLTGSSLSIDRTQIVEVTKKRVIIHDRMETAPAAVAAPVA